MFPDRVINTVIAGLTAYSSWMGLLFDFINPFIE